MPLPIVSFCYSSIFSSVLFFILWFFSLFIPFSPYLFFFSLAMASLSFFSSSFILSTSSIFLVDHIPSFFLISSTHSLFSFHWSSLFFAFSFLLSSSSCLCLFSSLLSSQYFRKSLYLLLSSSLPPFSQVPLSSSFVSFLFFPSSVPPFSSPSLFEGHFRVTSGVICLT